MVAGLLLAGLLVIALLAGIPGFGAAHAAGLSQAATSTPVPPPAAVPGDPAADQTSATVDLRAGFIMDPYLLPVVGKAETSAAKVMAGCNGFVAAKPAVVVNWAGDAPQLNFFVYSDDDPVLVIQKPDGSFVCNDDAGARTVNPLVTIKQPASGAYKIHVGAANDKQPALGFLGITQNELDDARLSTLDLSPMLRHRARPVLQSLQQFDPRMLRVDRAPIFGATDLKSGFKPVQVFAAGGGDIAAIRMQDQKLLCAGFVAAVPSYSFTWSGSPQALRLFFEGAADSALAVVAPEGADGQRAVLCNMDSAPGNLNPAVDIPTPAAGKYLVYVAAIQPNAVVGGKLTITGDTKAAPAVLQPAGQ
jgi:hypothetical protein